MKTDGNPTQEIVARWHKDPNNWKWGILYYNKNDKRIFPPKRNKYMGWTVNFANSVSVISLIVIIIMVLLISKFLKTSS